VIETSGAPVAARRRRRPRPSEPRPDPAPVPMTRTTVIDAAADPGGPEAEAWLAAVRRDHDALDAFVAERLQVLNRTLHAHATAAMDPYGGELSLDAATVVRVGYGGGEEVADGDWREAIEIPRVEPRRRRTDALRPQERVAAVLGGRDALDACETLLLRARLDLDQGRNREAALQLRIGLEALLAELDPSAGDDEQRQDLDALRERREAVRTAADEAAGGDLDSERTEQVGQTLAICERVLRRRRILSG
jgi:hypothetical protein